MGFALEVNIVSSNCKVMEDISFHVAGRKRGFAFTENLSDLVPNPFGGVNSPRFTLRSQIYPNSLDNFFRSITQRADVCCAVRRYRAAVSAAKHTINRRQT